LYFIFSVCQDNLDISAILRGKKTMKIARRSLTFLFLTLVMFPLSLPGAEREYPGTRGEWNGYDCYAFDFEGRCAKIVVPQTVTDGTPWIWRARFFGHEPQTDLALLERGFHVLWLDSTPLMGSSESVALWQRFYLYATETFGLNSKAHLEGMSRGGLYAVNWAIQYPDETASIYIDNPVLDFKCWPGGFGKSERSVGDWNDVLASYGLSEKEAETWPGNPVDNPELKNLAEKKVPILIVCGDSDRVVPFEESGKPFIDRYRTFGGPIEVIIKPGCDHHPHSLVDPRPIVDFILNAQSR
jgi:pimeloyl-ACP methyl ester carboxylesterase